MKTKTKIIFAIVAAVIITLAVSVIVFFSKITNPSKAFKDVENTPQAAIQATTPPTTDNLVTPSPTPGEQEVLLQNSDKEFMKKRVNVLLLGLDKSTEREKWGSFRTDTMIVASINFDDNKIYLISIPRDSYVKINNRKSRDKINSAFGVGGGAEKNGYQNAMKTVSNLFGGVNIDYYVGFDMNVVKEIVDVVGGIDYNVDIEVKMNGRFLHPGQQKLDGQGVLDYSRVRKGSSDVARAERQQKIIVALFDQLKNSKQITKIPKLYSAVAKNIQTNLNFEQISAISYFATKIQTSDIEKRTVEGEFLNMNELSYWGISQNKLKKLVFEVFGKNISTDPSGDVYAIKREIAQKQAEIIQQQTLEGTQPQQGEQVMIVEPETQEVQPGAEPENTPEEEAQQQTQPTQESEIVG